ncbi:hypothetical protein V7S43_016426 [Phytophthora oleae]|uniref:Tubulin-specific chaperone A n=1 Tax=Phytophthora oleae TaxID=2107226 RepID=A0ABD3EW80_9STRA
MANKVDRTLVARGRAIAAEDVASAQVLDARREVLRLQHHFPDTHSAMRAATRELTVAREVLADTRRVAEEADRNCEAAFAEARDRRFQTHRERYDALDDEIQDERLFAGEQGDDSAAFPEEIESGADESDDVDEDSDYEGYLDTLPPPQIPRTRSRGSVSPLSLSGEAEYTRSLQPSSRGEETEEPGVQDADDTGSDN